MRRRIASGHHAAGGCGYDLAVFDDDRSIGLIARRRRLAFHLERHGDESLFCRFGA
jgi:hypothetical protein